VQTMPAKEIIVIDDCSTDGNRDIAMSMGVTTITTSKNTGSKAGAQVLLAGQVPNHWLHHSASHSVFFTRFDVATWVETPLGLC
jgi:hypothetical protein